MSPGNEFGDSGEGFSRLEVDEALEMRSPCSTSFSPVYVIDSGDPLDRRLLFISVVVESVDI